MEVSKYFIVTEVMKLEPALATPSFVLTCNEMMEGPTAQPHTQLCHQGCVIAQGRLNQSGYIMGLEDGKSAVLWSSPYWPFASSSRRPFLG